MINFLILLNDLKFYARCYIEFKKVFTHLYIFENGQTSHNIFCLINIVRRLNASFHLACILNKKKKIQVSNHILNPIHRVPHTDS